MASRQGARTTPHTPMGFEGGGEGTGAPVASVTNGHRPGALRQQSVSQEV